MDEIKNLYGDLSVNNFLELITVVSIYFIIVWIVGALIDNNLWNFYHYLRNKYPDILKNKIFILFSIILHLVIIVIISYIIIHLSYHYTLKFISDDKQIYMKIAMGILYAPLFFTRQKNLGKQLKVFELF